MTKPTEARQDELAIQEKIARELFKVTHPFEELIEDNYYRKWEDDVEAILSLTVSSGGACPECKGEKMVDSPHGTIKGSYKKLCPTCDGLGQKQPKTLGEIIKEFEDGRK